MQFEIKFSEWENLDAALEAAMEELRPRAQAAVLAALLYAEGELKMTLTGPRSGRTYKVSKTGKLHVASAPGEPPAVLFGNLRNSVGHFGPVWAGDTVQGQWGVGLGTLPGNPDEDPQSYAVRLEFGGIDANGVYIAPRPYMAPTELRVEAPINAILEAL